MSMEACQYFEIGKKTKPSGGFEPPASSCLVHRITKDALYRLSHEGIPTCL